MLLRFSAAPPAIWIVLVALGAALAIAGGLEARRDATRGRKALRFALRSLILGAIAFAAAGPIRATDAVAPRHLILALDAASLSGDRAATLSDGFVTDAFVTASRAGIALETFEFSESVAPLGGPRASDAPPAPGASPLPRARSRLAPALAAARMAIPADESGAVVVFSDGNADPTGAAAAAARLAKDGIPVRAFLWPPASPPAAAPPAVTALDVPDEVRGPFAVHAAVSGGGSLDVRLFVDGLERETKPLPSGRGTDVEVEADGIVLPPGLHEVAAWVGAVGAKGGPDPTSLRRSLVRVTEAPRVLVVSDEGESSWLGRALAVEGLHVTRASAAEAAARLAASRFDAVALDSDAAASLSPAAAATLASRVREGLGLFVAAGRTVHGWEALADSPLRDVLPLVPVRVAPLPPPPKPPKPPRQKPPPPRTPPKPPEERKPEKGPGISAERRPEEALPISLLLVIDRSSSMEGGKLELAILAAEAAAGTLSRFDRVAVASFAETAGLEQPFRPAGVPGMLTGLKMSLHANGKATDVYAGLEAAERIMTAETNPIRHVILLTDGRHNVASAFPPPDPLYRMADRGITLSTIGVGDDVDEFLLKRLARLGSGRFFFAPGPQDIPRVFTRDTTAVLEQRSRDAQQVKARLEDPSRREPLTPPPTDPPPESPEPSPESAEPPEPPETPSPPPPPTPPAVAAARLVRVRPHEALAGFSNENLPTLGPPRPSSVAAGSSPLLAREDAKPVLAARRPGLGRSLLWAVPPNDPLVDRWPDLVRLLAQSVRSVVAPVESGSPWVARVVRSPGGDVLRVSVPDARDGDPTMAGVRVTREAADGEKPAKLEGIEDGEARYLLPPPPPGSRTARARIVRSTGAGVDGSGGPPPPITYIPTAASGAGKAPPNAEGLERALGVSLAPADATLWEVPTRHVPVEVPLAAWFIGLAVLLLPFDVWAHRRGKPQVPPVGHASTTGSTSP